MFDVTEIVQSVFLWSFLVIFFLGILGNLLALIVFMRRKFRFTVFQIYFPVMLVCQSFEISYAVCDFLTYQYNLSVQLQSYFGCTILFYLIYAVSAANDWILVVVGFDRMCSILYPRKFWFRTNGQFQWLICTIVFAYNLTLYSPFILFSDFSEAVGGNAR